MNNTTIIIFLILCILGSSFFSATETAFSSINRIRLKNMAEYNKKAKVALQLLEDYDQLLSTILVGNNIVNIGATAMATVLFTRLYADMGASISTAVMTIVILIFGEVTPKSIAKESPEKFCLAVAPLVSVIKVVLTPVNWFFKSWTHFMHLVFKAEDGESMTQEELLLIVEEAQEEGDLEEHESDLITAAIEFNDLDVRDILTPRVDIISFEIDDPLDEIEETFRNNNFSRLPVYEDTIDNIIGVVHEKDFYGLYHHGENQDIRTIVKNVNYTSNQAKISNLLRQLQKTKTHLAVVIDEFGGTAGIITMEDILEELVGEIYDEHDDVVEYIQEINDDTWIVQCEFDLEDLFEFLDLEEEEDFDFISVGGWVVHEFENIPSIGDKFNYHGYQIEVTDCDDRKVEQIKIQRIILNQENVKEK